MESYVHLRRNFQIRKIQVFGSFFTEFWSKKCEEFNQSRNHATLRFLNKFSNSFCVKAEWRLQSVQRTKKSDYDGEKNEKNFNFAYFTTIFEMQVCFLIKIIIFKFHLLRCYIHFKNFIFRRLIGSAKFWFALKILQC